ncbi:MAG: helix-turn-helix transcriptional regulator [Synergistaceae bacterium]|nr:helix-turn-helix transcriptional regulator [Synergistaceae bacterium]MBP9626454.1 helix-turn-helix transcriptional regulator [Synergistaceae bacterium]MBP9958015.1 helix-turn-helix transcriptional regulator [Synergistaceae bacterium]
MANGPVELKMAEAFIHYFSSPSLKVEVILSRSSQMAYPQHSHISTWVIGLIKAGSCTLRTKSGDRVCSLGDIYTLAPDEVHSLIANEPYDAITLCINASLIANHSFYRHASLLFRMMIEKEILTEEDAARIHSKLKELLDIKPQQSRASDNRHLILELKRKIEARPEKPLTLQQMSAMTHLSPYHFIRIFKSVVGLTPHQFQRQNRARLARGLISKGVTIADAATHSGFYDQSHFCRCFKDLAGMTPRDYALSRTEIDPPLSKEGEKT